MNKLTVVALAFSSVFLVACGKPQTQEEKVAETASKVYNLTADERALAEVNAKQFFNKQFPAFEGKTKTGMFLECRPTDSNYNGLVTCMGYIPSQSQDLMDSVKRYCGYRKDLAVGCSDEDTVK